MLCLTAPEGRAAPRVARAANTALAAAPSYARHVPERTLLYALVQAHYPDFIVRLEAEDRPLPEYVREEFETYLRCGVLEHGFLRAVCEQCRAERLVAYSCKKRGFCPSCGARRMAESARHLVEEVSGPRPVRQWVFFRIIFLYLDDKVAVMRDNMLSGFMQWALSFLIMLVTAWIAFQGWLIVTGRSREPMMALVTNALRIGLVSMLAMAFSYRSDYLGTLLSDTLPRSAMGVVTGEEDDPADKIDRNFALMGATFAVMNAFAASSGGRDDLLGQVRQATTMSAVGTAGPAVIGGALLLAYKVALALFVGFGPLFILCLIFPSTRQLFSKWLYYGIGTVFSLAVLSFMVGAATELVAKVGAVMLAKYLLLTQGAGAGDGLNAIAMWTVLLGAAGADELVAGALEEMLARRRADDRRLVAELARRSVIPAQGDPDALADELSFLMSPDGYQQFVAQSGWQPDRYRRWIGDQVIARAQPAAR